MFDWLLLEECLSLTIISLFLLALSHTKKQTTSNLQQMILTRFWQKYEKIYKLCGKLRNRSLYDFIISNFSITKMFEKSSAADASKFVCKWERVNLSSFLLSNCVKTCTMFVCRAILHLFMIIT